MKQTILNSLFVLFLVVFVFIIGPFVEQGMNPYYFSILMYAGINITLAVSLNLVNGITGLFSMGHAGFMSVGAYVSAMLTLLYFQDMQIVGMPEELSDGLLFAASLLGGGLCASFLGFIVGLPSLRLRGDYLAIVTLGFGEIVRVIWLNVDAVGAARGLPGIPMLANFGWVFAVAILCIVFIQRLRHSPHGRALLAIREDEIAAQVMGIHTTRYKVLSFMTGAFFAGVAGGLLAHYLTYLNPKSFDFNRSFEIIIMVVLGGMGSMTGATFAAVFLTLLREMLRPLQEITGVDLRMILYSLALIVLMLTRPNGLFGTKEFLDLTIFRRFRRSPKN